MIFLTRLVTTNVSLCSRSTDTPM